MHRTLQDLANISPSLWKRCASLLCCVTLYLGQSHAAQAWSWGNWRLNLTLRTQGGVDTNVRRLTWFNTTPPSMRWLFPLSWVETRQTGPPPLLQYDGFFLLGGTVKFRYRKQGWILGGQYQAGGKLFILYNDENVLAQNAQLYGYRRLHKQFILGLFVQGTDQRRVNQSRESSAGMAQLALYWSLARDWQLAFLGGYNGFAFRNLENFPESYLDGIADSLRYSYHGDRYELRLRKRFGRIFRAQVSYAFSRLFYGFRLAAPSDPQSLPQGKQEDRTDQLHQASVSARLLFEVMLRFTYGFSYLSSRSFGETFVGHRFHLLFASELFWKITWVLEGQLFLRTFQNGVTFNFLPQQSDTDAYLSTVTVRLTREIWKPLFVDLRYSFYTNLLSAGNAIYLRHLFLAGLSLRF